MPERDANQLAADVPDEVLERIQRPHNFVPHSLYDEVTKLAENALGDILRERRELVALVGTLQQERDEDDWRNELAERVERAEAAQARLTQARWEASTRADAAEARAEAAEAALATVTKDRDGLARAIDLGTINELRRSWHERDKAEAALAEARETVANLCTRPGTCLAGTGGDTADTPTERHREMPKEHHVWCISRDGYDCNCYRQFAAGGDTKEPA